MKKRLIRILSLLLIFAMLIPTVVACKDDPPAGGGGGEGSGSGEGGGSGSGSGEGGGSGNGEGQTKLSTVEGILKESRKEPVVDFTSEALLSYSANNNTKFKIRECISHNFEKTTFAFDLSKETQTVTLPAPVDVMGPYFIEFEVYSSTASGAKFTVTLPGCEASVPVVLDFVGMKTYKVIISQVSVRNPRPPVTAVTFSTVSGAGIGYVGNIYTVTEIYDLAVPEGVDLTTAAPFEAVIDSYVEYAVGKESDTSPLIKQKREFYTESGKASWDYFKDTYVDATTKSTLFWDHRNWGSSLNEMVMCMYENINAMANAYAAYGEPYYKDPELLDAILKALEHGYNCAYGKDIVDTHVTTGDWYHWDVPIPKALTQTLCLIYDDIDYSLVTKYLEPFRIICYFPEGMSGNKLMMGYNVILASALEHDASRLVLAKELIYDEFFYQDAPEDENIVKIGDGGPYTDGSYIQHGEVAYTGVYGMAMLNNVAALLPILGKTPFDLDHSKVSIIYEWIFNNYNSVVYEGAYMPSLMGRGIQQASDKYTTVNSLVPNVIVMSNYAPDEWKNDMLGLAKYYISLFDDVDFTQLVPASFADYCKSISDDSSITPWTPPIHTRIFGAMARAFHYGPKYGVSISMSSTHIAKYESINTANETGWYHGDGMIYIHAYDYDFDSDFFYWADPYLMPGVTANTAQRNDRNIYPMIMNSSPFAGGVAQGKFGVAGYIVGYNSSAMSSGTFIEEADTKITARKSYFMFDNEIVCVGSGINDFSGDNVVTVVENRKWTENNVLYINGELSIAPATVKTTISARTMHFSNMGGYVFLRAEANNPYDGAKLTYQKATHTPMPSVGSSQFDVNTILGIERDFLEIVLDHGIGDGSVENNKYFYAYLPESTVQETEEYYADPDAALLLYNDSVHAVIEKKLGIVALNCFAEGSGAVVKVTGNNQNYTNVREISPETPCSVMISKNESGETVITVSDPTMTYRNTILEIALDSVSSVVSKDDKVDAQIDGNILHLNISTLNSSGTGFTVIVK